ncbi:MAG TPA: hydrogenase maturation nickel metallochaperone HypA, partial [Kofleriaceae bacterium]|nr:hydrogenase maturation nickel metallochaperone HypA [Kofleriaceae bacterium]
MHEYSIIQALAVRVEEEMRARGATSVSRIELDIGEVAGVEVPLLETAFATFRERTALAGAELAVHRIPASWRCSWCGREIERGKRLRCAMCGVPARLAAGDEI